jgi:hypothetical protein
MICRTDLISWISPALSPAEPEVFSTSPLTQSMSSVALPCSRSRVPSRFESEAFDRFPAKIIQTAMRDSSGAVILKRIRVLTSSIQAIILLPFAEGLPTRHPLHIARPARAPAAAIGNKNCYFVLTADPVQSDHSCRPNGSPA